MQKLNFIGISPRFTEDLLESELKELGAIIVRRLSFGILFEADLKCAYKICLWSRIASRIMLVVKEFTIIKEKDIYNMALYFKWDEHLDPDQSFSIDAKTYRSEIKNSNYAGLLVKDGLADFFLDKYNKRPSVNSDEPDVKIHLTINREEAVFCIDISGESLHRRGYRIKSWRASLKENLAASILYRAGWPKMCNRETPFIDPMCGSGTLLIEAALIAGNVAPGLYRERFGFTNWKKHDQKAFESVVEDAEKKREAGLKNLPKIVGFDIEPGAVKAAILNTTNAGLEKVIHVEKRDFNLLNNIKGIGLVCTNPPYGERMGKKADLVELYSNFGKLLKEEFQGWQACLITDDKELSFKTGLRAKKHNNIFNGQIKCIISIFDIDDKNTLTEKIEFSALHNLNPEELSPGALMIYNRIKKNIKRLKKYLKNNNISSYRIYDADMPEYAAAIDIYENTWLHIQEYQAPKEIEEYKTEKRFNELLQAATLAMNIETKNIYIKQRKMQKGKNQYEKQSGNSDYYIINENGLKFYVNFSDFLDTGIFLDHRITRKKIMDTSKGKSFLNLFSYTATASVHAAKGGATETTSVDTSTTYLDWAKKNFSLNRLDSNDHHFINKDCMDYMKNTESYFDIIFCDPPTFSNSKDRREVFDVQRDHIYLIKLCVKHLNENGVLIFSNNFRKFKMDDEIISRFKVTEITKESIPEDYFFNDKIHKCWVIKK